MSVEGRQGVVEVWRPAELPGVELRRGFGVARPVPRHWHEEYQLCMVQEGSGDLRYRGSTHVTPAASLFIIHPGEVHSNRAHDRRGCSYRTVFAGAELVRQAAAEVYGRDAPPPFFKTAVVFDPEVLCQYLELHLAFERPSTRLKRDSALLRLLATLVKRFAEGRPPERARGGGERGAVRRARDYLAEHFAEQVSLGDLARVANLSPFHFSRVFAEETGMPPHAFQIQLRVSRAQALLRAGWPIPQVATQTGFADQSHLTRHFKRLSVVTPGQYSQNRKNVQDNA